ncbi:MAG: glycosyltransferase family 4 protein [candidate division NC10 bacterium]|nr:glycosyltransferase family 4 protein [candidate division NC10 bacterium]
MGRRFNIAMVAACPFPTAQGSQVFIRQLAEALHTRGHRVHLVTYHLSEPGCRTRLPVVRTRPLPGYAKLRSGPAIGKPLLDFFLAIQLATLVRGGEIDIIHAHNYEAALAAFLIGKRWRIPVIYHAHTIFEEELPTYFPFMLLKAGARWLGRQLDSFAPRRMDRCLAITSPMLCRLLERGVQREKIDLLPPGIFYEEPREEWIHQVGRSYSLDEKSTVLYAGNLDNYQRVDLLLEAFEEVRARCADAVLLIVTNSNPKKHRRLVERLRLDESVRFLTGLTFDKVSAIMACCHVAVLPRLLPYGLPIKLLNYMAAGMPVVAFRRAGHILDHLQTGYLVSEEGAHGLADGIVALLTDRQLAAELGANARKVAGTHFDWEDRIVSLESIYENVIFQTQGRRPPLHNPQESIGQEEPLARHW